jgi:hypothetical protein
MRTLLAFAIIVSLASCQRSTVDSLFSKYKKDDNVIAATLTGWLVERGLSMALKNDEEAKNTLDKVVNNIKKVRVLVSMDNKSDRPLKDISSKMREGNYQMFAMVNHPEGKFNLWIKEKENKVRDIFLYINSDENIVLLQVKGDINMDVLEKVNLNPQTFEPEKYQTIGN